LRRSTTQPTSRQGPPKFVTSPSIFEN
jgi:hypothetical protein